MDKDKIIECIFQTLQGQRFADFYKDEGTMGRFITGDLPTPTEEEVKLEIASLFHIK